VQDDSSCRTSSLDRGEPSPTSVDRFPSTDGPQTPAQTKQPSPLKFNRWSPWSATEAVPEEELRVDSREARLCKEDSVRQPPGTPRLDATSDSEEDPLELIESSSCIQAASFDPSLRASMELNEEELPTGIEVEHVECDPVFSWFIEEDDSINSSLSSSRKGGKTVVEELSTSESHLSLVNQEGQPGSESLLGLVVGADDYEDDESTVYEEYVEEEDLVYRNVACRTSSFLTCRTSSFLSKGTETTGAGEDGVKRVRFSRRGLERIRYITDDEDSCNSEEVESENHLVGYMAKTHFIMQQLSEERKGKCQRSLSNLSRAFCKSRDKSLCAKSVTELQSLYTVAIPVAFDAEKKRNNKKKNKPSKRKSFSKKARAKKVEETAEETLRGLEVHMTDVFSSLQRRHRDEVLRVQDKQKKRQQKKLNGGSSLSLEADVDVESRIRKASRKASRPLRYMAIQMAKHDTKEALRSVLSRWKHTS